MTTNDIKGFALAMTALSLVIFGMTLEARDSAPAPTPVVLTTPTPTPTQAEAMGMVEILAPEGWTADIFPCTFDETLSCYWEPAPTN